MHPSCQAPAREIHESGEAVQDARLARSGGGKWRRAVYGARHPQPSRQRISREQLASTRAAAQFDVGGGTPVDISVLDGDSPEVP